MLHDTPVFIPLLMPAPSGLDEHRKHRSSLEVIKAAAQTGVPKGHSIRVNGREVCRAAAYRLFAFC